VYLYGGKIGQKIHSCRWDVERGTETTDPTEENSGVTAVRGPRAAKKRNEKKKLCGWGSKGA